MNDLPRSLWPDPDPPMSKPAMLPRVVAAAFLVSALALLLVGLLWLLP